MSHVCWWWCWLRGSFLPMYVLYMMCFSVLTWDKSNDVYYIFMWYLQFPGLQVNDSYFAACFDNGMLYVSSKIEVCYVGSWMASLGSVATIVKVSLSVAFLFKVNVRVRTTWKRLKVQWFTLRLQFQIWDRRRAGENPMKQISIHSGPAYCCAWHPEQEYWIMSAGRDKMIKVRTADWLKVHPIYTLTFWSCEF